VTGRREKKRRPSAKQQRYVAGVLAGQTRQNAALAAGYSPSTARNLTQNIENAPAVRELLSEALENAGVTLELLAKRCREGLDAMETKFFQYEGRVIESRDVVNFGERRKMVELCCHLKGLFPATRVDVNGKTLEELLTGTYGD